MNINLIRTFLAVADHGSATAAGLAHSYSQPTVSQHIRRLEADLGVRLFHRERGGMILTRDGEALLPYAREAARAVESMTRAADARRPTACDSRVLSCAPVPRGRPGSPVHPGTRR